MIRINTLWPKGQSWSTLVQVMTKCCQATRHYLNQCWLLISEILWHSYKNHFPGNTHDINLQYGFPKLHFNSLGPSDAYMRLYNIPTLVQIMACRLFGAKPLFEPMLPYCQLDPKEQTSTETKTLTEIHISSLKKNAFENVVCEISAILSRPQCVNNYYRFSHGTMS